MMLPLAVRVPLLAGIAALLVGAGATELAFLEMNREFAWQARKVAAVYLDGLSAAVLPTLRDGDPASLHEALDRALGFHEGVLDRRIVVATPDGAPIARVARKAFRTGPPPPLDTGLLAPAWAPTPDGALAWAQRPLLDDGKPVALLAVQLDFQPEVKRRRAALHILLGVNALVGLIGAAAAALLVRRAQRPFLTVAEGLGMAASGELACLPLPAGRGRSTEARRLVAAFNAMVAGMQEREDMRVRLAAGERSALLGRLAATVAHEVRNPLAGMLMAIGTARHFGSDISERQTALDLLERGLHQIEAVVRFTLEAHRGAAPALALTAADFDDLRVLADAEARRRGVVLRWKASLVQDFPVDAIRLRQAVLNLLLNAIAATPPGKQVALRAGAGPDGLTISVSDCGPGLPQAALARLRGEPMPGRATGLGLTVVAQVVREALGQVEVGPCEGEGTCITLRIPVPLASTLDRAA